MTENLAHDGLLKLRDKALRYIRLNGADKPKGEVPISDLKSDLGIADAEYRSLYIFLHDEHLIYTDARKVHIGLTPAGRTAAEVI
jgi:hypothetical protein